MEKTLSPGSGIGNEGAGTIDHVFDVLNKHEHPLVLVGHVAHRWMGCASYVDEGFDLVIRKNQMNSIVAGLIETSHWTTFNCRKELEIFESDPKWPLSKNGGYRMLLLYLCDADVGLQNVDLEGFRFDYMRVWSDETYHIDIDRCPFVEVPELHPWNTFLVEKEFDPALQREWRYGPRTLDQARDGCHFLSTVYPRAKGLNNRSPIFVLRIPAYLDALVYRTTHYQTSKPELVSIANWQIRNLTRYLYLELPHQKNAILFQVEAETERYMEPYFERYVRKPRFVLTRLNGMVRVHEWDPATNPNDII